MRKLFRTSDIVLIGIMLSAAAVTYHIKDRAEAKEAHIHMLQTQIRLENDQMDVLKADWSLMTQPARLQRLVGIYDSELQLQPVRAEQIIKIDDLPLPPVDNPSDKSLGGVASNRADVVVTGSVAR